MEGGSRRKNACSRCCTVCLVVGLVLSVAFCVGLGLGWTHINAAVRSYVQSQVALTPDGAGTQQWISSSNPLYAKFTFFCVNNTDDVETKGAIPTVEEAGPFVYDEHRTKYNLLWNEDQTQVRYSLNVTYVFNPSLTDPTLSNPLLDPTKRNCSSLNVPLVALVNLISSLYAKLDNMSEFERDILKSLVEDVLDEAKNYKLFETHTIDELLFGYNNSLLWFFNRTIASLEENLKFLHIEVDSYFSLQNRTSVQEPVQIYTGKGDSSRTGQYLVWNGQTSIASWGTSYAGMLNGTDGTVFHPGVTLSENLTLFVTQIYRSGHVTSKGTSSQQGIPVNHYVIPTDELKNSTLDPGFFSTNFPTGVLNMSCVSPLNAPIFASMPHFLNADDDYRKNVTGITVPDESRDGSFVDVEPLTGAVVGAARRLQINVLVQNYSHLPVEGFFHVPGGWLMMPVFWATEEGNITAELANEFKNKVFGVTTGISWGIIGLIILFGLFAVVFLLCSLRPLVALWKGGRGGDLLINDEHQRLLEGPQNL